MRTPTGRFCVCAAIGTTAITAACVERDARGGVAFAERDSAGVVIQESAAPELATGSWTVAPAPLVTIGAADGDEAQALFRVAGAVVLTDGRVVVAHDGEPAVRWFAPDGSFLYGVGRQGEGPGEVGRSLDALWALDGDSVATWEHTPRRMYVFGPEGRLARSVVLELPPDLPPGAYPQVSGRSGRGFVAFLGSRPDPGPVGERARDDMTFVAFGPDGSYEKRLATLPGYEHLTIEVYVPDYGRPMLTSGRPPFAKLGVSWVHGDRFYYGSADAFEVAVYDFEGDLRRLVRTRVAPVRVTRQVRAAYIDRQRSLQRGLAQPTIRPALEDRPFPDHLPAHRLLRVDRVGWLWVQHYPLPGDEVTTWSVFEPSGRWVTDVGLPVDWRIHDIGSDYVLAVLEDELGVERVMKLELVGRG